MEHRPVWRRVVVALALSALLPVAVWLCAACLPALFPERPPVARISGPAGAGDVVAREAANGRILVDGDDSAYSLAARRRRADVFARAGDETGFTRKAEPAHGDWLASFPEPGQTVAEYLRSDHNRKSAERHTIHLQPYHDLAPHQRELIPDTAAYIEAFFDSAVVVLPQRSLDPDAWSAEREQWDSDLIADAQRDDVPRDSLGLIGLIGGDLHAAGLRFVFGVGLFQERVGVYSLHRYGERAPQGEETERQALRERAFKLVSHELGHMFGIEHCVFYECVMNGVNSLDELDRSPAHLCPVCHEKLRHALGFDPQRRYARLADAYARHNMHGDERFARDRASH